jgi:TolB-like protein
VTAIVVVASLLIRFTGLGSGMAPSPRKIRSIAVLPLDDLGGDPSQAYFTDGMTEALITHLAKISSLRVISRTSAMHYKGANRRLPEIARELNVDSIVEGSVLRAGNRVRITAQLIYVPTDQHPWANSYERDLQDVLALQGEVAGDIAEQIEAKLTPQEQVRVAKVSPCSPQAHDLVLQAAYHWFKARRLREDERIRRASHSPGPRLRACTPGPGLLLCDCRRRGPTPAGGGLETGPRALPQSARPR